MECEGGLWRGGGACSYAASPPSPQSPTLGVELIEGRGRIVDAHTVDVDGKAYTVRAGRGDRGGQGVGGAGRGRAGQGRGGGGGAGRTG